MMKYYKAIRVTCILVMGMVLLCAVPLRFVAGYCFFTLSSSSRPDEIIDFRRS